jgi:hypothetical protein
MESDRWVIDIAATAKYNFTSFFVSQTPKEQTINTAVSLNQKEQRVRASIRRALKTGGEVKARGITAWDID